MGDYISRDMAIARLTKVEVTENLATMTDAKRVIAEIPAADVVSRAVYDQVRWERDVAAVPVVRCKDCKHFNFEHMECENEAVSTDHEGGASYSLNFYLDDFCSYGQRKEETND